MKIIKDEKYLNWLKERYTNYGAEIKEINPIGIRNPSNMHHDVVNDVIGLWTEDTIYLTKGSTDPGVYWTEIGGANVEKNGVAHLCLGYHHNIWRVKKYKNSYFALCNDWLTNDQKIWRDVDKDYIYTNKDIVSSGWYGIHLHRMNEWKESLKVGKWSAGCQLISIPEDYNEYISIVRSSKMYKNYSGITKFSYYLFHFDEVRPLYEEIF